MFLKQILAACIIVGVGGCVPVMQAGSAIGAISGGIQIAEKISATADPIIKIACEEYQKGRAQAEARIVAGLVPPENSVKVHAIHQFGDAACAHPPDSTIGTAIWLGTLVGQAKVLTTSATVRKPS